MLHDIWKIENFLTAIPYTNAGPLGLYIKMNVEPIEVTAASYQHINFPLTFFLQLKFSNSVF